MCRCFLHAARIVTTHPQSSRTFGTSKLLSQNLLWATVSQNVELHVCTVPYTRLVLVGKITFFVVSVNSSVYISKTSVYFRISILIGGCVRMPHSTGTAVDRELYTIDIINVYTVSGNWQAAKLLFWQSAYHGYDQKHFFLWRLTWPYYPKWDKELQPQYNHIARAKTSTNFDLLGGGKLTKLLNLCNHCMSSKFTYTAVTTCTTQCWVGGSEYEWNNIHSYTEYVHSWEFWGHALPERKFDGF